jgi:hypothetical protein
VKSSSSQLASSRDHERDPIGMELCLRQPMRSSCCQPAWITEKIPIGVELCLRQSMRSYSSQPEISRGLGYSPKECRSVYASQLGVIPASLKSAGFLVDSTVGMELCVRQPMRSCSSQPEISRNPGDSPIGMEICVRQRMRSYSSQPKISRVPS